MGRRRVVIIVARLISRLKVRVTSPKSVHGKISVFFASLVGQSRGCQGEEVGAVFGDLAKRDPFFGGVVGSLNWR